MFPLTGCVLYDRLQKEALKQWCLCAMKSGLPIAKATPTEKTQERCENVRKCQF